MKFHAEIKELPDRHVACVRHIGPYPEVGEALQRVFEWAGSKGLIQFPGTESLAVYYDSPETVDVSKLRSDGCITVPEGTPVDGEVSTMKVPGGRFAVAHVEIDANEYGEAWDKLVGEWMPENGAKPDESRLCYELYLNDPDQHSEKKHIVDICEPVQS